MKALEKFKEESGKKFINMDITINKCNDFKDSDIGEDDGK